MIANRKMDEKKLNEMVEEIKKNIKKYEENN